MINYCQILSTRTSSNSLDQLLSNLNDNQNPKKETINKTHNTNQLTGIEGKSQHQITYRNPKHTQKKILKKHDRLRTFTERVLKLEGAFGHDPDRITLCKFNIKN